MSLIAKLFGFLVLAVALNFSVPAWAQKGTIKIAVQAPLSGEQAAIGDSIKLGAQLAVEESVKAFKRWAMIWSWSLMTIRPNRRLELPMRATSSPIPMSWS